MSRAAFRVLVTPTTFGKSDPQLKQTLEESVAEVVYNTLGRPLRSAELAELLPGCHGYIAGLDEVSREALQAADKLRVISRYGVGVDRVDLSAAAERGIVVTNTPDANSVSVAELTIAFLLSLARRLPLLEREIRMEKWPRMTGLSVEGKTVGLIGLGAVGREVASRLRGWNCRLLAADPAVSAASARERGVELVALSVLTAESDFVSLHLPAMPSTVGMVNAAFLAGMKPGSHLINTARGELIDEAALVDALRSGRLRGAALDTFASEPLPASSPLLSAPNLILTPHCGAHTDSAANRMGWGALNDCLAVLRGLQPAYPVVRQHTP